MSDNKENKQASPTPSQNQIPGDRREKTENINIQKK